MKKIVLVMALMLATMAASASETLYFTYNQSLRAVTLLNNEDELMIYCGYDDELPTYCLVNEVWAEQISSSFYEIWIHGYDAYTGEEIYMPIDMECIWLLRSGHIISAAQTLRFRNSHARPTFVWQMPHYNPWVRGPRPTVYYYSYHYDIHRPGWHWRHHPEMHYHPYYCRPISHPAPMPPAPFTPGKDRPGYKVTKNSNSEIGYEYIPTNTVGGISSSRSSTAVKNDPTSRAGNRITSSRSSNTVTTTDRLTGSRSTTTAPAISEGSRSTGSASRSTGTSTSTGSRSTAASTSKSTSTGTASRSTATQSNGRSSSTGTASRSTSSTGTASRSTGSTASKSTSTSGTASRSTGSTASKSTSTSGTASRSTSSSKSTPSTSSSSSRSTGSTGTVSRSTGSSKSTPTSSRSTSSSTQSSSRSTGTSTASRTTSTGRSSK